MTNEDAIKSINIADAKAKLDADAAQAIDVRPPPDWAGGHVKGARNIPLVAISSRQAELAKDRPVLFFSEDGVRSRDACQTALSLGFTDVFNVEGGVFAWMRAGHELETI